jgi:Holliday junction resolvasome RuvABC endonuclease subunit
MVYVGLDPGADGAIVVLRDRCAHAAFWWSKVQRKGRRVIKLQASDIDGESQSVIIERYSSIGSIVSEYLAERGFTDGYVCCEDVYLGRNVRTLIDLARNAGLVLGSIEEHFGLQSSYVAANEWRQTVLGVKRGTKRDQVKNASMLLIPSRVDGMRSLISLSGSSTHICDAAGVAEYCRVTTGRKANESKRWFRPVIFGAKPQ